MRKYLENGKRYVQIKLLLMPNRKFEVYAAVPVPQRFPLAPKSMTLNCYKFEFSENFADLGGNNCQADEDTRTVLSATAF